MHKCLIIPMCHTISSASCSPSFMLRTCIRLYSLSCPPFLQLSTTTVPPFTVILAAALLILGGANAQEHIAATQEIGCPSILIVGASGFVGSFLFQRLQMPSSSGCKATIVGASRSPLARMHSHGVQALHSAHIADSVIESAGVVLYLGGLSSREKCIAIDGDHLMRENVNDVAVLASRMNSSQLLIFASTSAISDGLAHAASDEDHGVETSLDACVPQRVLLRFRSPVHLILFADTRFRCCRENDTCVSFPKHPLTRLK
jgi:hypothetical protein